MLFPRSLLTLSQSCLLQWQSAECAVCSVQGGASQPARLTSLSLSLSQLMGQRDGTVVCITAWHFTISSSTLAGMTALSLHPFSQASCSACV